MDESADITKLLELAREGDSRAFGRLFEAVLKRVSDTLLMGRM